MAPEVSVLRRIHVTPMSSTQSCSLGTRLSSTPFGNNCECRNCEKLEPEPPPMVGKIWTPIWVPLDTPNQTPLQQRSFPNEKRRKVHIKTKNISDKALLEELKQQEREKEEKEERKKLGKAAKIRKAKKTYRL